MVIKTKKSGTARKQDRSRVAGGHQEVRYVAKKADASKRTVKAAVKKAGPSRKRVSKAVYRIKKGESRY